MHAKKIIATHLCIILGLSFVKQGYAQNCDDLQAARVANEKALSFFQDAEVIRRAKILKYHHLSNKREVASYVKTKDNKKYTVFTLVNMQCNTRFIKATR
ncbi:hypothetical protein SAMN05421831_10124 [Allopseudospirillum japonicum]|uniref:Uncharacterized protein n=2 Tax=Allopseudospirillum japonicum TaxID=64971 RepID=A0A1H6Q0G0_9GAMM|nr:hypothetical protein SAMN05421831_10124 [Allopseudospirillum japonicum]